MEKNKNTIQTTNNTDNTTVTIMDTPVIKLVVLGDVGVGKTSLLRRYLYDSFTYKTDSTIGSSFHRQYMEHQGKPYKIDIWDTAGQERFRSLAPLYFRNADIVLICLDLTQDTYFERFMYWNDLLDRHALEHHYQKRIVIGTKIDCVDGADSVHTTDLHSIQLLFHSYFVEIPDVSYFFTSSKDNRGVRDAFQSAIHLYFRDKLLSPSPPLNRQTVELHKSSTVSSEVSSWGWCSIL